MKKKKGTPKARTERQRNGNESDTQLSWPPKHMKCPKHYLPIEFLADDLSKRFLDLNRIIESNDRTKAGTEYCRKETSITVYKYKSGAGNGVLWILVPLKIPVWCNSLITAKICSSVRSFLVRFRCECNINESAPLLGSTLKSAVLRIWVTMNGGAPFPMLELTNFIKFGFSCDKCGLYKPWPWWSNGGNYLMNGAPLNAAQLNSTVPFGISVGRRREPDFSVAEHNIVARW